MITRSSIAFEDFLGSSIAPQVMPPWSVTLFGGYSYDGVSAAIGVQHTEVANLGVVIDTFWRLLL